MAKVFKNLKLLLLLGIFSFAMVNSSLPPEFWRILYRNFGYPRGYGPFGPLKRPLPPGNPHFKFPFIGFGPVQSSPQLPSGLDNDQLKPQEPQLPPSSGIDPNLSKQPSNGRYKIVCYYESSAANRSEQGRFVVSNINPFMCSHVIYSFAILDDITYTITSANKKLDITQGGYKNATNLKLKNPDLKVMISIGGPNEGGLKFSLMTRSAHLRTQFVESAVQFLQDYGFDGIDVYWEYPGSLEQDGRCEDKENFVKLIKELRLAFLPHRYLLSAVIAPLKEVIDNGYNLPELSRSLDFFNVIAYDLRGSNATKVDHHSPLNRRPHDEWENVFLNVEYGIRHLLEKGADGSKLNLGIPFYGKSFTLEEKGNHALGSLAKGPGLSGSYTNKQGYIAYYEICPGLLDGTWKIERDEYGKVPYAYSADQWVGYDDENSIENKMEFIKDKRLGGAMIWSIDLDDFSGRCGGKWPLTRKIYSLLCGTQSDESMQPSLHVSDGPAFRPQIPQNQKQAPLYIPVKVPFAPIHTQPAMEVRTALYAANTVCKSNKFIRDPIDCSKFFRCNQGLLRQYICPYGLQFNEVTHSCDWANYAKCQLDDATTSEKEQLKCTTDGIYHDPHDCHKYYMCTNGEPIQLQCSPGTAFSKKNLVCDWERNVDCQETTTSPSQKPDPSEITTSRKPEPWEITTSRKPEPWEITTSRKPEPWEITTSRKPHPWEITTSRKPHPWEITTSRKPHPWEMTTSRKPDPWEITTSRKPEPWEITTSRKPHPWEITTSRKPHPWEITTSRKPHPWEITTSRKPEPWEITTSRKPHPWEITTSRKPEPWEITTSRKPEPWEITTSRKPEPWEITTSRKPEPWEITTSRKPEPWEITTSRKPEPWEITTSRKPEPWEITTSRKPEPWEITTSRKPHPWEITTSRKPHPWEITTSRKPHPWEITTSREPHPWEITTSREPHPWEITTTVRPLPPTSSPEIPTGMTDAFKVVCYFTNWAWYRPGDGKYLPEDVDTALCTHVIYAFTVLDGERLELKPHDPWADIDNHFFERIVNLKKVNPKLKVLVGLGGWTDSLGSKYSRLVNNQTSRQNFIEKCLIFINQYGFDGMDLDWEYPKCWQVDCDKGPASDKSSFAAWVRELRAAFDSNAKRLLLTAAVSPSKQVIDLAYDVADIAKNLDFINVMTYDYHGSWEKKTGHVAPLHYFPGDEFENFNANFTLNYYVQLGAPREKLIMGMPFYGQAWSLADNAKNGLNAPTYGPGDAGPFSRQGGMLGYNEICTKINDGGWSVVSDPQGRIGPFAFKGNQWFSFDDIETIRRKAQFVYDNRFGGAMLWALDFDDFRNICCKEKYPLLKTINRVLRNYPSGTNPSGGTCNYKVPFTGENKPIMTEIRRVCITSRCLF